MVELYHLKNCERETEMKHDGPDCRKREMHQCGEPCQDNRGSAYLPTDRLSSVVVRSATETRGSGRRDGGAIT
jgi:hypothetical protein